MIGENFLERPESLMEGKSYYLKPSPHDNQAGDLIIVIFVAYTACPAVVIVQDPHNELVRCSRDNLFRALPIKEMLEATRQNAGLEL